MWTSYGGAGPDPEELRRFEPPDNELPVGVPLNVLLARTDELAMVLLGAHVYSTGLAFDLVVMLRHAREDGPHGLDAVIWGHGPRSGADGLLLGVELADGQRVSNAREAFPGPEHRLSTGAMLHSRGGSGGQRSIQQGWWLTPIPPAGPLRFVVRCSAMGVAETIVEVDATPFQRAAQEVVELWPWTPPPDLAPPEPPAPDLPPDSWFSRG